MDGSEENGSGVEDEAVNGALVVTCGVGSVELGVEREVWEKAAKVDVVGTRLVLGTASVCSVVDCKVV